MRMLFKQRFFSWFDSYNIYNEAGNILFSVEGKMAWGHKFEIHDGYNNHIGTVKQEVLSFLHRFNFYVHDNYLGQIKREFTFFSPRYTLEYAGWSIEGDFFGWNYQVVDSMGVNIASVSKQLFEFTDTYVIDVYNPDNTLTALMIVLAIDAANCSDN